MPRYISGKRLVMALWIAASAAALIPMAAVMAQTPEFDENDPSRPETVQADVSTRRIPVTSSFTGT